MDQTTKQELIARYRGGHRVVMDAVTGLTDTELDTRGEPGEWTPRQIIHHLADSEMTSAIRLRRLLAENRPEIQRYDEEAFAARLHYDRPIGASLDALKAVRASSAELLDRLSETD